MKRNNERYARHYALAGFGEIGQEKLLQARVLVIGAGGLGCPVLQYLAAAGIGTIGIADHDRVALSNLQRQTLYTTGDVGCLKAVQAAESLRKLNPEITIETYTEEVTSGNAWELIERYDIVADCTDNFASRYLISDACFLLRKPLVFGAVFQYEGQVAVFDTGNHNEERISYRDLFPEPPAPDEVMDCNEAGVLGVLPGMIGTLQANEVIKLITGIGEVLRGRLLIFNMLTYETLIMDLAKRSDALSLIPENRERFEKTDYRWLCGLSSSSDIEEISPDDFPEITAQPGVLAVDVRERGELPEARFPHIKIPLSELKIETSGINNIKGQKIILFCQSGKRSLKAAELLAAAYGTAIKVSHLKGGITALQNKEHEKRF
ncbi:HesA/MoeB/ThiF family protein [Chryseobacterium sp. JJR-5R]|uniref:HesA/MoeB/ThiF family protein n=1 Tax=Chryseobacterium sp. JJR-5R TaxID=3093923 RepID=UPI002A75D0F6|nr:HesA/MoeB/ThiF family protein [Chryseobacterium sp. JJR-5R]WPO81551.1 HesA/MoeB/ThiF family protein [Chryseobacterium sp. JJR-5R]